MIVYYCNLSASVSPTLVPFSPTPHPVVQMAHMFSLSSLGPIWSELLTQLSSTPHTTLLLTAYLAFYSWSSCVSAEQKLLESSKVVSEECHCTLPVIRLSSSPHCEVGSQPWEHTSRPTSPNSLSFTRNIQNTTQTAAVVSRQGTFYYQSFPCIDRKWINHILHDSHTVLLVRAGHFLCVEPAKTVQLSSLTMIMMLVTGSTLIMMAAESWSLTCSRCPSSQHQCSSSWPCLRDFLHWT